MSTVLISPYPVEECVERLKTVVDPWWKPFGTAEVSGSVGRHFRLRQRIWYRNSFQTVLAGSLTEDGTVTRIACHSRMNLFTLAFMFVWFGFLVLLSGASILSALGAVHSGSPFDWSANWFDLLAPPSFCVALVAFGRYLARHEKGFLIGFLRDTLAAKDAPDEAH